MGNLCSCLRNNNKESNDSLLFTEYCEFCNKTFTYNNYNKHIVKCNKKVSFKRK